MVDVENNTDESGEDSEEEIKVCEISEGIVSEERWRDELKKDEVLMKVISSVRNGWCKKSKCEERWRDELKKDEVLMKVISSVRNGWCEKSKCEEMVRGFWQVRN
ncbi:hypothetical protein NDU88_004730 [Pleurodeles waltl]|uniref:Uncharacterized protein n=1 Tax=Pleurodeles waltl TaxID=8319 RepID=A0AAV7VJS0_PLEWA|nr:hypothetical protein NDU88_004730 [Pleurodeles waltl]